MTNIYRISENEENIFIWFFYLFAIKAQYFIISYGSDLSICLPQGVTRLQPASLQHGRRGLQVLRQKLHHFPPWPQSVKDIVNRQLPRQGLARHRFLRALEETEDGDLRGVLFNNKDLEKILPKCKYSPLSPGHLKTEPISLRIQQVNPLNPLRHR